MIHKKPGYDPDLFLSDHFRLYEFIRSRMAKARGIPNDIPEDVIVANLRHLCRRVLEPVRMLAGCPVKISSGYRSRALNKAVGGAPQSQHLVGQAADFIVPSSDIVGLAYAIQSAGDIDYDQCILEERERETGHPLGPWSRWIHISHQAHGGNRGEILTKSVTAQGTRREWGIHPSLP